MTNSFTQRTFHRNPLAKKMTLFHLSSLSPLAFIYNTYRQVNVFVPSFPDSFRYHFHTETFSLNRFKSYYLFCSNQRSLITTYPDMQIRCKYSKSRLNEVMPHADLEYFNSCKIIFINICF